MKVLFVSNLFPDSTAPGHGQVNATVLHQLARHCEIRVIAPRPLLPFKSWRGRAPRDEDQIFQPQYVRTFYIPKFGGPWNHRLMARALREPVRAMRATFPFDVVLGAWVYPDACALDLLDSELQAPLVAIAQGTDVHSYLHMPLRKHAIVQALSRAAATITRSRDLATRLHDAGVPFMKLRPIYNGVDTAIFRPGDSLAARAELGLPADKQVILYVGNFLPVKNPLLLVSAHAKLCRDAGKPCELVMIGAGPLESKARGIADKLGFGANVRLVGRKSPAEVARYMQAADVLCVPSKQEGVPNVLLEGFACGLRAVATSVGGIPEVLNKDFLGRLVPSADLEALAKSLGQSLSAAPDRATIAKHSAQFSWEQTVARYLSVLEEARSGIPAAA
jgi:glycosyltransferase involved in cell wall biosynthesis